MNNKKHSCKQLSYCICSSLALEPNDNCPIHGYVIESRCRCGRFTKKENTMKKTFIIPCTWEMYGTLEIEAETLEKAIEIAEFDRTGLPTESYFIDGSFEVNEDDAYELDMYEED